MVQEFNWKTKDGIKIYGSDWSIENPKAVVCLVHGLGEHCRRYDHLAEYFNQRKYAVTAYDRRGHGLSEGKRGHSPNLDAFLDEISELLNQAKKKYPKIPVFLYGHSMGGNLVLNYVLRKKPNIIGTITTGAWIKVAIKTPKILLALSKVIRFIYPAMTFSNKLDGSLISSIDEEARKYEQDPLVHANITASTAVEMLAAAKTLDEYNGPFPTPLLMMHGASDPVIDPISSSKFVKQVSGDIEHQEFRGLHEIHYEAVRSQVFDRTIEWMDARLNKMS